MKKTLFISILLLAVNEGVFANDPILLEEENPKVMELEMQTNNGIKNQLLEQKNPSIIELKTQTADKLIEYDQVINNADESNLLEEVHVAQSDIESISSDDMNEGVAIFPNLDNVLFKFDGVSENAKDAMSDYILNDDDCNKLFSDLLKLSLASKIYVNISNKPREETNQDKNTQESNNTQESQDTQQNIIKNIQHAVLVESDGFNEPYVDIKVQYNVKANNTSARLINTGNNINFDVVIDETDNQSPSDLKEALQAILKAVGADVQSLNNTFILKETFLGTLYSLPEMYLINFF